MWQALYEELKEYGFTVITVAIDKSPEDARQWIERANPAHPSLIDVQHVVADLYNMVNVPTVVWIDEEGRIVRPNDVTFGSNRGKSFTGVESEGHLAALRAWVKGEEAAIPAAEVRANQTLPTEADQLARAEFGLGQWLFEQGEKEAATRHFERAEQLAPHDFTIRRGTMVHREIDPMGPKFMEMHTAWQEAGESYYKPLQSLEQL